MTQPDSDGKQLSRLWVEAASEQRVGPSPLSTAAKVLGGQDMAGEAVAIAAEKELVDLVFAVASTTLEMHRMAVDQAAPSVPLWSLSRLAADAMARIFLICTEPQELRGWARVRRRNTEQAGKFWAELADILPEGVELPADLGPKVTLEGLDAALAEMMKEPPGGLETATDAPQAGAGGVCPDVGR